MNLFLTLVFIYFLTLSIDLPHLPIFLFKCKLTHIVAPLLFATLWIRKRNLELPKGVALATCTIFFSLIISALFGADLARCSGYLAVFLFSFFVYFLLPFNLMQLFNPKQILKLYFLTSICVGLYGVFQMALSIFGISDPFVSQRIGEIARAQALTYEPSYFALYLVPCVMFYNAFFFLERNGGQSMKLFGVNSLLLVSISTGALLSYFFFFLAALYLKFPLKRLICYALVFLGCLVLFALLFPEFFLNGFLKLFYNGLFTHWSFVERWEGIVRSWNLFVKYPIFGVGLGGVGIALYKNHFFGNDSISLSDIALSQLEPFDPTNVFTEILASLGLFGLFGFALLLVQCLKPFKRALKQPLLPDGERIMLLSLLSSAIVMLCTLQFNQGLFRPYIWVHIALCLGYVTNRPSCSYSEEMSVSTGAV